MGRLFLVIIFCFIHVGTIYASEVIPVTVSGTGLSKSLALKDAFRNALESVSGTVMSTNTIVMNGQIVGDKTAAHSAGYVERYELLDEKIEPPYVTITIKAFVALDSYASNPNESNSDTYDIKTQKNIANAKQDSTKSLEKILSLEVPKMLEQFESCVQFKLNDVNADANFYATINISTDAVCFKEKSQKLSDFLKKLGFKISTEENTGMGILQQSDNKINYDILSNVLKNYKTQNESKNIVLLFKNDADKPLDIYKIDAYRSLELLSVGKILMPSIQTATAQQYRFQRQLEQKMLDKTASVSVEISRKTDNGYKLGIYAHNTNADKGVAIVKVSADSPANAAGIKSGDIIVAINSQPVTNIKNMSNILGAINSTDAQISIYRNDKRSEINVTLKRRNNKGDKEL